MPNNPKLEKFTKKWQGKTVLIMGLGLHGGGVGAAQFFAKIGAWVLITDLKSQKELAPSLAKLKKFQNIEYHLGGHQADDLQRADLIIKNPAVPNSSKYLRIAQQAKVPIETDLGIFFELCPAPIIGITGTKGKSTTAALAYKLLKTAYPTCLAGNIRTSSLSLLRSLTQEHKVVLELSSWQLQDLAPHKKSPHIALITRIDKDHLNRHISLEDYFEAKKTIFKFQSSKDHLFFNAHDPHQLHWAKQAPSQVHFYHSDKEPLTQYFSLLGLHNQENATVAIALARHFKIPKDTIKKVLQNFETLEGRLQLVAKKKGISFYNDTTATAPIATIRSLQAFQEPVILIAGGQDKNLDYSGLAEITPRQVKMLILLPGSATQKLKKELSQPDQPDLKIIEANNIKQAVQRAAKAAQPGDIVLFSPAATSFNQYPNEFARGQDFEKQITKIT